MSFRPLVVLDFDGVVIDGMEEYWWSSRRACISLLPHVYLSLPESVPNEFRYLRPWVNHGWEMVLLAAESKCFDRSNWMNNYQYEQSKALKRNGWDSEILQNALNKTRHFAICQQRNFWFSLHKPFSQLVERLFAFSNEGVDWAILTTKNEEFTSELLNGFGLSPWRIYGREAGPKCEVLLRLCKERPVRAFIEDRRATLEVVISTPGLEQISCFLASWGYLKSSDHYFLPAKIHLLDLNSLSTPLAEWP